MPRSRVVTLDRAVDRFLTEFALGGATERTEKSYRAILGYLVDALGRDANPVTVDKGDLLDVLDRWKRSGAGPSTLANRISALRTFFAWKVENFGGENPALQIKRPRKDRPVTRSLSASETQALLGAPMSDAHRLVIWMYVMTAMRRSELLDIRWRDVDLTERTVRVFGKGRKGRTVPLHPALVTLLAAVLRERAKDGAAEPEHFLCCRGYTYYADTSGKRTARIEPATRMGYSTPEKIIKRVSAEAGLQDPSHVAPHALRRGFANLFLRANPGDIHRLQALLGHSDIATTRIYLRDAEIRDVRTALDRVDFVTGIVTTVEGESTPGFAPHLKTVSVQGRADEGARTLDLRHGKATL
jgi:site-specific recombinase XerC